MKDEKEAIEQEIGRARDGVGERIDELDRKLRTTLDLKALAAEHAPQLAAGGAVMGFLVAFGFPKAVKTLLKVGLPIAIITVAAKKYAASRDEDDSPSFRA
jgi:hypothetical protein